MASPVTTAPPPSGPTSRLGPYRNYALLAGSVFLVGGAFGVQQPLFANFIYELFQIRTNEYGYIEALRETPGFLTAFVSALLMLTAAHRIAAGALVVMGLGIASYAWVAPIAGLLGGSPIGALIATSVFWSVGFHTWSPIEPTLALQFSPTQEKGRWLGWLRTASGVGHLVMMGVALLIIRWLEYGGMFMLAGGLLVAAGLMVNSATQQGPVSPEPGRQRRILFRRRYGLYYLLALLGGARRQIFMMFAVWLLVREHDVPRETILVLMLINQVVNLLIAPTCGRLVDRFGERITLAVSYTLLTAVFVGYALIDNTWLLCGLYVLDHVLFIGGIAQTTYLHKIASPEDLRPSLTMGVTMNHIPAVLVPLIGGMLWVRIGPTVVFLAGAGFAVCSLVASYWVTPQARPTTDQMAEAAD